MIQKFRILRLFSPQDRLQQGLIFLRFAVGVYFLHEGYIKFKNPLFSSQLPSILHAWAQTTPVFWYEDLLKFLIIPQAGFFGGLVTYAEMAIGLSFILGAFIPYTALIAVFLNLNFMLASFGTGPTALGINITFILVSLVLFWTEAGRYFGLDAYLFSETPIVFHRIVGSAGPPSQPVTPQPSSRKMKARPAPPRSAKRTPTMIKVSSRKNKP